ncbi:MAG: hypothetical protein ACE5L6_03300 [Candidatus Bathyarchaeia archaeon]
MGVKKKVDSTRLRIIAYVLGALTSATWVFISQNATFAMNFVAMTIALYAANSIVVGGGFRSFLAVSVVSFLAVAISDLFFNFLNQPFIAFCISLFLLLAAIKHFLIRGHDSGWFGALCIVLMGMIFLFVIEMILALAHLFLPLPL